MLEMIVDRQLVYVLIGVVTVIGIGSKCIVHVTLGRLMRSAENMSKSSHPLMRLVRAKFEHACMVSDRVENVEVFVDKYLYDYRIGKVRLHTFRRMEKGAACVNVLLAAAGAGLEYGVYGMSDKVLRVGAIGLGAAILVFLVHLISDERFRLESARNYMVDYLENVCRHRYEKNRQKEQAKAVGQMAETKEQSSPERVVEKEPEAVMASNTVAAAVQTKGTSARKETPAKQKEPIQEMPQSDVKEMPMEQPQEMPGEKQKDLPPAKPPQDQPRDVLIRQILEDFMA